MVATDVSQTLKIHSILPHLQGLYLERTIVNRVSGSPWNKNGSKMKWVVQKAESSGILARSTDTALCAPRPQILF